MCRVQKLLAALTDIIVVYHAHQFKCTDYQDSNAIVADIIALKTSPDDEEYDIVNLSIQYDDKKEAELQKLIAEIISKDTKRQTLLQYVLDTVLLIRPLVITPKLLEEHEKIVIQEHLIQFIITLQDLFKTQSPATIVVNYANKEAIAICGFLNELKYGGGLCTSGSIIQDKLLVTLFPCVFSTIPATIELIRQTVSDILRDQQFELLQQQNAGLVAINAQLRQKLFVFEELEQPELFSQTSFSPLMTLNIFNLATKFRTWEQPALAKESSGKKRADEEETETFGMNIGFDGYYG